MRLHGRLTSAILLASMLVVATSCTQDASPPENSAANENVGADAEVTSRGSLEVTAQLVEIPDGAIFERDLYNYATVLKYRVKTVHRGDLQTDVIYVGHYNPFKPRAEAADRRAPDVGGDLKIFQPEQTHRIALQSPIDDFYMGGIINKYFDESPSPIYWAEWTNLVSP